MKKGEGEYFTTVNTSFATNGDGHLKTFALAKMMLLS